MRGTIVNWFEGRGFGFVRPDDSVDRDVFIHASAFGKDRDARPHIEAGLRIEFETESTARGLQCANAVVLAD